MKKYFLIIPLLYSLNLLAQDYYSLQIDVIEESPDRIWQIIPIEEGIITLSSHICSNPTRVCSAYVLYDYEGNILKKTLLPWVRSQFESVKYDAENEEIIIAGHLTHYDNFFQLYKCNLDGDILFQEIYEIPETEGYGNYCMGVVKHQDKYVLFGDGKHGEATGSIKAVMMWINMDGTLDTIIHLDKWRHIVYQGVVDNDGLLTVMYAANDSITDGYNFKQGFLKFNANQEIVWEWTTPDNIASHIPLVFTIANNNDIVYITHTEEDHRHPAVQRISDTGEVLWTYEFPISPFDLMYIAELKMAANGDIIGTGKMRDGGGEPDVDLHNTGFSFRMTGDGELLWKRVYRDFREDGVVKYGSLHDIAELSDGRLLMGGQQYEDYFVPSTAEAWLILSNEEGCLGEDYECVELIILDAKEQQFSSEEISVIQNPIAEKIRLNINTTSFNNLHYRLLDNIGRDIGKGKINPLQNIFTIEMSDFPNGMYYLYVNNQDKSKTFKIIKN